MHLLFPRFHPVAIGLYFCALGVCFVFGGTSSGEVLFAIDPFTATALTLAAAQVGTGYGGLFGGVSEDTFWASKS